MYHGNGLVGQLLARVQRGQLRVVPLADRAQKHLGQNRAGNPQLTGLESVKVDYGHRAADDGRELHHTVLVQVGPGDRGVGSTERDRLGANLANAPARTNRLVVQAGAGFLLVSFGPLGINREREGGTCARDVGGHGNTAETQRYGCQGGGGNGFQESAFHREPFTGLIGIGAL